MKGLCNTPNDKNKKLADVIQLLIDYSHNIDPLLGLTEIRSAILQCNPVGMVLIGNLPIGKLPVSAEEIANSKDDVLSFHSIADSRCPVAEMTLDKFIGKRTNHELFRKIIDPYSIIV